MFGAGSLNTLSLNWSVQNERRCQCTDNISNVNFTNKNDYKFFRLIFFHFSTRLKIW